MSQRIDGKRAVIVGAGSGVGRATAQALASAGALVGLVGRDVERLERVAAEIRDRGGVAFVAAADAGDEPEIELAIASLDQKLGGVDIAICAAGIGVYGPVEGYALSDWERTIRTNLTAVFLVSRAVIPSMRQAGGGAIVAVGSGAGKQGYATLAAYSASKFGLLGLMQSLAAEVGGEGIKVSTVLPGSILTDFGGRSAEEKRAQMDQGKRYLEPEDVAEAIVFLLGQDRRAWTQELNLWPA